MARDSNRSRLARMMKLTVTAFGLHEPPAIVLQTFNYVANLYFD